ncbi:beta-lactamase family protein [Kribbella sandramycini]|uniref:Beta-lactamase family protein n=1 Tax=Kribbella sandramycini TaxID=60450 RepID=A0A7Y4P3R3_9ACTN|nr:serine hydrolase domain-containing protein [Kribbella sandramycini]MBB6571732.1 CubicO group peptidase (beta-lactamase class C family) [Kribbella sandramycini]NOL44375.1 beta-lactamase family protein [Kribbella sandramycini]
MYRVALAVIVALGVTACSAPRPNPVAAYLARTVPAGPGGTVIAARGDQLVHCAGFGFADRERRIPATCDTVYDVMSITKQFTAAAVLELETMGKLRITDPIAVHLGPVPADKRAITIHHLLTHTSGLVEGLGDDYDVLSREQLIKQALASKLTQGPDFQYSNLGYGLLAAIIEKVSGLGYEEFLAKHLFEPAGMTDTGYLLPRWPTDRVAVEYDAAGRSQGRPMDHPWADDGPHWNLRGSGGLLSTARDLFRWHRALLDDTVLPASTRTKLFTPHTAESYAYGWNVRTAPDGDRLAWHDGGNDWSLANYARSLTDQTMSFWVTNQVTGPTWNFEALEPDLTLGVLDRV